MGKAKGKETNQNREQRKIIMGIAKGKETKQNKEQWEILKWARLREKKQNRTGSRRKS